MSLLTRFALVGALFGSTSFSYAQTGVTPLPTTPLSLAPAPILGPSGLRRETGRWLFNDSIFVTSGANYIAPNSPVFIPNLRRDKKNKLPRFMPTATRGPLNWAMMGLPALSEMSDPAFDFTALQTKLTVQVNAAKTQGLLYVGWSLSPGYWPNDVIVREKIDPTLKRLRAVLDAVSGDSALILTIRSYNAPTRADFDAVNFVAPYCDALVLGVAPDDRSQLWLLKMARRVVEEQKDFDLPIFIEPIGLIVPEVQSGIEESSTLEFFMGGATGFIVQPRYRVPAWAGIVQRDKGFFSGAVTLEDAAVLPVANPRTLEIVSSLRAAGRIPLAGRLPSGDGRGESLLTVIDEQTTTDDVASMERAARAGATLYLEGTPDLKNAALLGRLEGMLGITITVLPTPRSDVLSFDDPWLFGTARGQEFPVLQRLKWTIKNTLAGQTRVKKGEDSTTPFAAAKLTGDENGLLFSPLGKGRIIWLAHDPQLTADNAPARRIYMSAIAGLLQASLVKWKWPSVEAEVRGGAQIHAALRGSAKGTPLLALWNDGDSAASLTLSTRGDSLLALDLASEKDIPVQVVDYSANLNITIPAHGWTWLAFGTTRKELDKER